MYLLEIPRAPIFLLMTVVWFHLNRKLYVQLLRLSLSLSLSSPNPILPGNICNIEYSL
jgi:hypothetical protein